MRIVAWVATKVTHGPPLVRLGRGTKFKWRNLLGRYFHFSYYCTYFSQGLNSTCLVSHGGMNDRWSTCKFRNARSAFRNLHVDPLSFIPPWETNKYNSILIFILYQNCTVLATIDPFFNFSTGVIYSSLHRLMSLHGKMDVKIFLMFIVAENTKSVNITRWSRP